MKALLLDGPNQGVVNIDRDGQVLKVLDPTQSFQNYRIGIDDPQKPIKVNSYYRVPLNPVAFAHGFEALYRFSGSNI